LPFFISTYKNRGYNLNGPSCRDLETIEEAVIRRVLAETDGNVSAAAPLLGLSRGSLRGKLVKHNISNG